MEPLHQWEPVVRLIQRKPLKPALLRRGILRLLFDAHQFQRLTRRESDAFGQRPHHPSRSQMALTVVAWFIV